MGILRQIKRLQYIDYIIRRKATGNLRTFAEKNRLSKRGLAAVLQEMREMGFPVKYSRQLNSYYYEEDGEMVKCLFIKHGEILTRGETRSIGSHPENLCFSKVEIFEICENS
ncbi:hypothetical protein [Agriterribacter sp.]|uniref:hypothetical protein n=1 Tax=Agriterribacter sp. TaxID=2821509 RepID=UPI002CBF7C2B|nr:hypothetical protein [Agriterribacter sp.]HTN08418.1 hypothetical protein [Agriterribacter sp.]